MNVHPSLVIGAMMSGATFGSMFCFYSDVVFMAAAGTGVSNIRQIHVSAPYILSVAAITSILYLITGLVL
jgi:Na+/H+ antiporter NhaC